MEMIDLKRSLFCNKLFHSIGSVHYWAILLVLVHHWSAVILSDAVPVLSPLFILWEDQLAQQR